VVTISVDANEFSNDSTDFENCPPLCSHIKHKTKQYLQQLNGHDEVSELYAMVMAEVEKPMLEAALEYTGYNQSKAAKALGLSRSTLRKKLDIYGLN
jgi:Fis family transcriptional regulator